MPERIARREEPLSYLFDGLCSWQMRKDVSWQMLLAFVASQRPILSVRSLLKKILRKLAENVQSL